MKNLSTFFVSTASGAVYEVKYTKTGTTAKKIFAVDPKKSKAKVGDELLAKGKFVCITADLGLWKCNPDDGKRFKFEDKWPGSYVRTSVINGLLLKKEDAITYCKYRYNNVVIAKEEWYELPNRTKDVLEQIGENHPAFILAEELLQYIKKADIPF